MMDLLSNDLLVGAVVAVITAAWATFKTTEVWRSRANWKAKLFAGIVEAVVERVYRTYVRPIKAARAEKDKTAKVFVKLTEDERKAALSKAQTLIVEKAKSLNLGDLPEVGDVDLLHGAIEKAIRKAKGTQAE